MPKGLRPFFFFFKFEERSFSVAPGWAWTWGSLAQPYKHRNYRRLLVCPAWTGIWTAWHRRAYRLEKYLRPRFKF